jgi:phospho-N-acetylmuramoyl-pentapeptide-transferase
MANQYPYLLAFIISFLISAASLLIQISWSRQKKLGQSIRSDGPQSHHQKSGTPTMGGLSFLLGALATFILFPAWHTPHNLFLMAMVMGLGFLGGLDDFLILKRGKNQGLYGRQKILGQLIMAVIFSGFLIYKAHHLGAGAFLSSIGLGC